MNKNPFYLFLFQLSCVIIEEQHKQQYFIERVNKMGQYLNPWLYNEIKNKKINENTIPTIYYTDINNFPAIISQVNSIGWYLVKNSTTNYSQLLYFDKTPYPTYYGAMIKLHGDIFSPDCCTSNPVNTMLCTGETSHITSYCAEVGRYNQTNGSYVDETIPDAVLYNMVNSLPTQNSNWIIGGILAALGVTYILIKRKK